MTLALRRARPPLMCEGLHIDVRELEVSAACVCTEKVRYPHTWVSVRITARVRSRRVTYR